MRLTARFSLLVLALVAAVGASAFAGTRAIATLDRALQGVVDGDMQRVLAITHARRVFRSMTVLERDYILSHSAEERRSQAHKMQKLGRELAEHLERYASLMPAEDAPRVEKIRAVRARWLERDTRVLRAADVDREQASKLAKEHHEDPVSWEAEIGALVKSSEARLAAQVAATHDAAGKARTTLYAVSALAALIAVGLGGLVFVAIRKNLTEIVHLNSNLEGIVVARTQALHERERSLRLVLDSTGDGLVMVGLDGVILGECSRAAVRWFGEPAAGTTLARYLQPTDELARLELDIAFQQLAEDLLPWELSVAQFPSRIRRGEDTLELELRQVFDGERFSKVLVIVRDISAKLRGEDAERASREQQEIIGKLLSDKGGFAAFVADTEALLGRLVKETDLDEFKRYLHTFKGNTALFGMQSLADAAHALENETATSGERPRSENVQALVALWQLRLKSIEQFLKAAGSGVLEVATSDHADLMSRIVDRRDYDELLNLVEMWTWTRTSDRLGRLRAQIEYLAGRVGKSVEVVVRDNDLRIPPGYLDRLWPTLVHVIRNAVDHGIEAPEERERRGKPERARLELTTDQTDSEFILEIRDDGPGIDRDALLARAASQGIALAKGKPVEHLIFEDGLSTRHEVSELSGRGVGLAATRQACEAEGGTIEVLTVPGRGTTFRLRFQRAVIASSRLRESGRRWSVTPAMPA